MKRCKVNILSKVLKSTGLGDKDKLYTQCAECLNRRHVSTIRKSHHRTIGKWTVITFAVVGVSGMVIWKEVFPIDARLPQNISKVLESNSTHYLYLETKINNWNGEITQEDKSTKHWKEQKFSWFPWLRTRSDDPWTLLRLAQSNNHTVRLLGVQALASKHHWKNHQYRQIAQACDMRTLVGLARSAQVDQRYFLPPPTLLHEEKSEEDQFREILTNLPQTGVNRCIQHFTSTALQQGHATENKEGFWYFDGTGLEFVNSLSEVPVEKVEKISLDALAIHSTVTSHCPDIVQLGGLQLLQKIQGKRKNNVTRRLIARIIGNLAVDYNLHSDIIKSGWVSILADWVNSPDLSLALHSSRALINLDVDYEGKLLEDGVYLMHPRFRNTEPIYADVVFVHGLLGGPFVTWRQGKSELEKGQHHEKPAEPVAYTYCWPKDWLAADCRHLRIFSVEYETNLSDWTARCPWESDVRSLRTRSTVMLKKLKKAGIGKRPIIWVGHSMGGLLIKKIIEESLFEEGAQDIRNNTRGFIFYSVPHRGSQLAAMSKHAAFLLYPSPEVLELSSDSPSLRSLHAQFVDFVTERSIPCLSFGELRKTALGMTIKTLIVPPESSDPGVGEYHPIYTNHLNICKPLSRTSPIYQMTLSFIHRCVPETVVDNLLKASVNEGTFGTEFFFWHKSS
ncbi:protein SERAC1-like [Liolophura sinensis]|uniref:protein SERAC1-like n=1 Tax=Liolophura sinensis TaxID=3198878 RepID=UPI00315954AB